MKLQELKEKVNELGVMFYKTRHQEVYTDLYNILESYIKNVLRRRMNIKDESKINDVFNEVMYIIYTKIDLYKCEFSFYNWVFTIMINYIRSQWKKNKLKYLNAYDKNSIFAEDSSTFTHEDYLEDVLNINVDLYKCIDELEPHYKEIIIDKYINEMKNPELMKKYNTSEGNIKNRVFSSKNQLKKIILQNNRNKLR